MSELLPILGRVETSALLAKQEADALALPNPDSQTPSQGALETFLDNMFERNRSHRENAGVDEAMLTSLRAVNGEYDDAKLSAIKTCGGSDIYMGLTGVKYRAAIAWLLDIFSNEDDKTWGISPSPIPDLPPSDMQEIISGVSTKIQQFMVSVQQSGQPTTPEMAQQFKDKMGDDIKDAIMKKAAEKAEGMENLIHDQLVEGGWSEAFFGLVCDIVGAKAGIVKGPIIRMRRRKKWRLDPQTGLSSIFVSMEPVMTFERVSPFDAFPSPTAVDFSGDFIERFRLTRGSLNDLDGLLGYNPIEIMAVLEEFDSLSNVSWLSTDKEREKLEDKQSTEYEGVKDSVEALECWVSVSGDKLLEFGKTEGPDGSPIDPNMAYDVCVIKIGPHIIYNEYNTDPLRRKPYCKMGWSSVPGSFWYRSLPELMGELQDLGNASMRSLVNNMAIACLPGDTIVYRQEREGCKRPRKYGDRSLAEVTLAQLWEQKSKPNSGLRRNVLRSLNEESGAFFGNRIVDIFDNGVQPVYRVTTRRGYSLKATLNHRFLSSSGEYRLLEAFSAGDLIAVNGRNTPHACVDCGGLVARKTAARCRKCASSFSNSSWNQEQAHKAVSNTRALGTTARGRKLVRLCLGNGCEQCGVLERLQLHHVDKNPLNCCPENLRTFCEPCHKKVHARVDNYGDPYKHVFLDFDTVTSIVYAGAERVFDLQMEAPNHNFVANGFVSHNSGPQVAINDIARMPAGEDITAVSPFKVWQFTNKVNSNVPPLTFFQPDSNAPTLLTIWDRAVTMADDWSGVPAYQYGTPSASAAGRTSSGLSMLMSNSAKGIKRVILEIDRYVFKPLIERIYDYNMMTFPDESLKGDMIVETRGAVSLMVKETMSERRMAFLQATMNPTDLKLMGLSGRARVLREAGKTLELGGQDIVQDEVTIERQLNQEQAQQADAAQQEMQLRQQQMQADLGLKQGLLELQKQELALKAQELQQVKAPVAGAKLAESRERSDNSAIKNYLDVVSAEQKGAKEE